MKYNYNDFIGQVYGKIKIIDIYDKVVNDKNIKIAKCKCDCGNIVEKRFYDVKDGKITSCKRCDSVLLIGKQFGKLTVINTFYKNNKLWCKCSCTCGNVIDVSASNLKRNNNTSCKKCDLNLLVGKTFEKLTVIDTFYKRDKNSKVKL